MPRWGSKRWVLDREAYAERRAIMEYEGVDALTASRAASEYAYHTRFGEVATAMANGDPEPARAWAAETAQRFGQDAADELIRDLDENIETELKWRR
jgi:hypothetical protein